MTTVAQLSRALQTVLTERADRAAKATGFVRRRRKLTGSKWVQTLVFGWMSNPDSTLSELCSAGAAVRAPITPQGLDRRFGEASAECMRRVLEEAVGQIVVASQPASVPLLERFGAGVWVRDATTISLPDALEDQWRGCGGRQAHTESALKAVVKLDLLAGGLQGPYLQAGRDPERVAQIQTQPVAKGALELMDLGFWDVGMMAQIDAQGAYVLSRLKANTAVYELDGTRLDVAKLLRACGPIADRWVLLGGQHKVRMRMLAAKVPASVLGERRRKVRREAQKKGRAPSKARLALVDYNVYVTNVPEKMLNLQEALVLARARWQIEILFRLWKSHGKVDRWRSRDVWRILTEVYAKLLGLLIEHSLMLLGCWRFPNRSLSRAAATPAKFALMLASAVSRPQRLQEAIELVVACIGSNSRMHHRRKTPYAYQLLLDPSLGTLN